jgi:hypothetical protein
MDQSSQQELLIEEYIQQMTPLEKKAYEIAKTHLNSSFDIVKSNGFIEWKKKK